MGHNKSMECPFVSFRRHGACFRVILEALSKKKYPRMNVVAKQYQTLIFGGWITMHPLNSSTKSLFKCQSLLPGHGQQISLLILNGEQFIILSVHFALCYRELPKVMKLHVIKSSMIYEGTSLRPKPAELQDFRFPRTERSFS